GAGEARRAGGAGRAGSGESGSGALGGRAGGAAVAVDGYVDGFVFEEAAMAQKKGELIVGLDIGTTKICCIVGEVTPDGIDVIGIGTHPSRGLRKGVVINIEAT